MGGTEAGAFPSRTAVTRCHPAWACSARKPLAAAARPAVSAASGAPHRNVAIRTTTATASTRSAVRRSGLPSGRHMRTSPRSRAPFVLRRRIRGALPALRLNRGPAGRPASRCRPRLPDVSSPGAGSLRGARDHEAPAARGRGGRPAVNGSKQQKVSELLHEAGETHHRVFRIVDGADDDWATWYADWLVNLSELPALLGAKPPRSELTYLLVGLAKQYAAEAPGEPWETYYARQIIEQLAR